jgi:sigma-B regulation protein RsbU (phosphoserine phosphatase)
MRDEEQPSRSRPPLVFVVDDDPTTVSILESILRSAGFQTASAASVSGALECIPQQHPDLVLLDVNLTDGCGFDVCRALQADPSTSATPILFISAQEDVSTKVQGFEAGGVDYITKPVSGAEVLARVRTHLRLKQSRERLVELQAEHLQGLAEAQMKLMPRPEDLPQAKFQVCLRQVLAAGGDFYDVIPASHGLVDYLVADASGHDLASSFWTAALKALAAEYAGPIHLPLEIVSAINGTLCRVLPSGAFFTLIYASLNHQTGRLALVSAAHPPLILVHSGGSRVNIVRLEGDVVGAFQNAVFGFTELTIQPGDRMFLYSDGLIETGGSHEEGINRLAEACLNRRSLPLAELVPAVVDEITAGRTAIDDTLLLGIER